MFPGAAPDAYLENVVRGWRNSGSGAVMGEGPGHKQGQAVQEVAR